MGREKVSGTVIRTRRPQTTVPDTFSALTPFPHLGGTLGAADGGNQFAYDSAGRVTSLTDLNGGVTQFAYDSQGNLLSLTDPVGNTTSWLHDSANQVTQQTDALGASRHFTYDSTGNLSRFEDRNGQVRQYGLDSAGNLASEPAKGSEVVLLTGRPFLVC